MTVSKKKGKLKLHEQEILKAVQALVKRNGGQMPKLQQIADEIEGRVKVPRISQILRSLEDKGFIRHSVEVSA